MAGHPRPLSPHLQIYRQPLTAGIISILHRITGIGLAVGLVYLVWWLIAAARGAEYFDALQSFNGSIIGRLLLFAWTLAFFYHLLNGIRHLAWDAGWGFDLPVAEKTAYAVIIGTIVLTLVAWVVGYYQMGAF
jgi:succinate dehydrogenase / fumarate reductase cytochrome b subunit